MFLTAIVLSLLVKNPGADDDEDEDDEEKPHISADDPLLHEDSSMLKSLKHLSIRNIQNL